VARPDGRICAPAFPQIIEFSNAFRGPAELQNTTASGFPQQRHDVAADARRERAPERVRVRRGGKDVAAVAGFA
jgi:hypothetical protein